MPATVHMLAQNSRTYKRKRLAREATRRRLISRIGVNPVDAPLYDEQLRLMAWEECLRAESSKSQGDLVPEDELLRRRIVRDGLAQIFRVYQMSAGFQDPLPPTEEQRGSWRRGCWSCEGYN